MTRLLNLWITLTVAVVLIWGGSQLAPNAVAAEPEIPKLNLTEGEKAWLAKHKTIRLGFDPNYPPFEFVGEDKAYSGLASEYARLVGERLGLTLIVVPDLSWSQALDGIKSGAVDILPAVTKTPGRDVYMNFSTVHLDFPDVILMREGHPLVAGLSDMRGRKVALVKGYATAKYVTTKYPSVQILVVKTPLLALQAVAEGRADATVQNLGVATYIIQKHDLTNLVVAAPADLDTPGLSFGVRKDWPEFVPILNKVLASITPREEAAIREKWGSTQYQIGISSAKVWQVALQAGGAGAVIVILFVFWNRRLSREVKQRRRAEAQLAEKEAQLRLALDNMPGGMSLEDRNLNYVIFNARYSELLEFPDGLVKAGGSLRDAMRYQAHRGDFGPGDKEDLVEQVVADYRKDEAVSYERTIAGSGRVLRFNVAPTPDSGYVTIITDITERKRAESAIAEQTIVIEAVLANMDQGVVMYDADLKVCAFNERARHLWRVPANVLHKGTYYEDAIRYFHDLGMYGDSDVEEQIAKRIEGVLTTSTDSEFVTPHGTVLEVRRRPLPDGGFVSTQTDITERKRVEEELAEKEAQLRLALDNMPGGLVVIDSDFNYVVVNDWIKDYLGVPDDLMAAGQPAEAVVRYMASQGTLDPGDIDDLVKERREGMESHSEDTMADGRTLQISRQPLEDGGYVVIFVDITEIKRAEKELGEKNHMLESLSNQLSKYLSPQVYASIFSGEQSVEIASERKKLTVFFSDIADFTSTTERLESEELTNLLNHYLTEMSKIALEHGATIDKYVGDSIIAFFGDPETLGVKEDAIACVKMAIAMQRRMRELQTEWLAMGLERPFQQRVGINTGFCTVGNFGSEDRMDYTIIGNEVNLTARLESLAEVGGILLAHETYSLVKETVMAEEGDALTVKGFAKPVRTYNVVGLYDDLVEQGRIIQEEQDGVRVVVELKSGSKADAIQAVKDVLSRLED